MNFKKIKGCQQHHVWMLTSQQQYRHDPGTGAKTAPVLSHHYALLTLLRCHWSPPMTLWLSCRGGIWNATSLHRPIGVVSRSIFWKSWGFLEKSPKISTQLRWRRILFHRKNPWHSHLKIDMEHNSLEVWFRSFSFLFMADGCRFLPLIFPWHLGCLCFQEVSPRRFTVWNRDFWRLRDSDLA